MGTLYIIATPIGNLADITYRAVETLKKVDFVACEDTRRAKILLDHYKIIKPLISYHQHSKLTKTDFIIKELLSGKTVALISDAGTPGISDPGGVLANSAWENEIKVVPIPGASAVTSLLSVSGWPTDEFVFLGFLPKKKGRQTLLKSFLREKRPIVFFESALRFKDTLLDIKEFSGENWEILMGRELTKLFEEIKRENINKMIEWIDERSIKGEVVVCIRQTKE
jgi:16S rRNA (cytidine1402-2'-O)-methyltransferase